VQVVLPIVKRQIIVVAKMMVLCCLKHVVVPMLLRQIAANVMIL
jgi:hypothetical protein